MVVMNASTHTEKLKALFESGVYEPGPRDSTSKIE
jgi:hypothetical protein